MVEHDVLHHRLRPTSSLAPFDLHELPWRTEWIRVDRVHPDLGKGIAVAMDQQICTTTGMTLRSLIQESSMHPDVVDVTVLWATRKDASVFAAFQTVMTEHGKVYVIRSICSTTDLGDDQRGRDYKMGIVALIERHARQRGIRMVVDATN